MNIFSSLVELMGINHISLKSQIFPPKFMANCIVKLHSKMTCQKYLKIYGQILASYKW